jgi:hypothetical protein
LEDFASSPPSLSDHVPDLCRLTGPSAQSWTKENGKLNTLPPW